MGMQKMKQSKKVETTAEEVFGKVIPSLNGGSVLDYQALTSPFEYDDAIIKCFCKNCGFLIEVSKVLLEALLNGKEIKLPDNITKEHYLEFSYCVICSGGRNFSVKLKRLSAN